MYNKFVSEISSGSGVASDAEIDNMFAKLSKAT